MGMFDCCIIICGLSDRLHRLRTPPPGYSDIPPQYCPSRIHQLPDGVVALQRPQFYRYDRWFTLCFIPIVRIKKGDQIMVKCEGCHSPMVIRRAQHVSGNDSVNKFEELCPVCQSPWLPNAKFCHNDGTPRYTTVL